MRTNTANFAQTIITAPSSGITTLIGDVTDSDTFPTTNFYATIQQVVADEIIKKEVVLCSTRTWTTFAVTRWQDGTSAQDFTTWGGIVYLVIATASGHIQDIWDKLDTVGTEIEELATVPWTAKTTPVNADVFTIRDSVASFARKIVTWANMKATLEVYFDMVYLWITDLRQWLTSNKMLVTDWSGNEWYADIPVDYVTITAWESITAWQPVRMNVNIPAWSTQTQNVWTTDWHQFGRSTAVEWAWQSFSSWNWWTLSTVSARFRKVGTPTTDIRCVIIWSDWSLIWTSTNLINWASVTTSHAQYTFNFTWIVLTPWKEFRFFLLTSSLSGTSNYYIAARTTTNAYVDWSMRTRAFWVPSFVDPSSIDSRFIVTTIAYTTETSWRVYRTNWTLFDYLWVAKTTATVWNPVQVDLVFAQWMSWLTPASIYYVWNTVWTVSTSPWISWKVIWIAISSTVLCLLWR